MVDNASSINKKEIEYATDNTSLNDNKKQIYHLKIVWLSFMTY